MKNTSTKKETHNEEKLGRISEVSKNSYKIMFQGEEIPAKLKGHFYEEDTEALPVVGDYVTFMYNSRGDSMILSVCERKSFLQRPDQAKTGVMQYMAANVDYLFIVRNMLWHIWFCFTSGSAPSASHIRKTEPLISAAAEPYSWNFTVKPEYIRLSTPCRACL